MNERGSALPLLAGYLSILLMASLGTAAVLSAESLGIRLQGIADAAVLAGHEQTNQRGVPHDSDLRLYVKNFLETAPSTHKLTFTDIQAFAEGEFSNVKVCATWQDSLGVLARKYAEVCRMARAKSFLMP